MRTWGKCAACQQLVRVRRDNGHMWVHVSPPQTWGWDRFSCYDRFPFWRKCRGSGQLPQRIEEREYPRSNRLVAFTPREEQGS